jgi:flagellar hook-associated protein 3 FlgL
MITYLDPSSEAFVANMERVQRRVAEAGQQVSSGKRVMVASDAPDEIGPLLQLRATLVRNSQIQSNLGLAKTETDAADNALNSATKLMDRALVLANQGANFTQDALGREGIANEVEAILEQMLAVSRTMVQDRYVFSGDQGGSPAYSLDLTEPNGVTRLTTALATRRVEDPAGGSFVIGKTAQDIFDSRNPDDTLAPDNVFAALNSLRLALLNNDTDAIGAAIESVKTASAHLNASQAFYGAAQDHIQDATSFAASYDTQLRTELSQKEDADVVAAALELSQADMQLQAAFQMQARIPHTSLFDFLA